MLAIDKLIKILRLHEYREYGESDWKRYVVNLQKTQLLVEDCWYDTDNTTTGSDWLDASEWGKQRLLEWLGY
jgi:hypothetical protein